MKTGKKIRMNLSGAIWITLIVFSFMSSMANGQCSNCSGNYPGGTFSTTSTTLTAVNTCIYGGEYSYYNVTAGNTYTWTTCGDNTFDTQLTLWSGTSCGTGFLAYNDDNCGLQSTITWTATFTGTVTLLVSAYPCSNLAGCMTVWWACTSCGGPPPPPADYTHPTTGINYEKVGACLVNDCGPFIYADNGGTSGNYSNNVFAGSYGPNNAPYRVFCPDQAGNCLRVTFNSFQTANANDVLWVRNGPTEFSPNFTSFPTQTTLWPSPPNAAPFDDGLFGNLNAACPFSFTSTDPSGCLTFAFVSNGSGTAAGWNATIECVPCASGPNGTDNNDCINATPLCSSQSITSNASGPGLVGEGCSGSTCPAGGENHTNWYTFTFSTGGTFNFVIDHATNSDDYDYALYGPNVTCNNLGNPIRCSDAGVSGNTGLMNVSPNENTENVLGDGWTETMNVLAGQSYYLVVDEWSSNSGSGYSLSFSGTASMDCSILPVELAEFEVEYLPEYGHVLLNWTTESEINNDRFEVERSIDGVNWEIINIVKGAGTTTNEMRYLVIDPEPHIGVNYYRLNQWDMDGNGKYSEERSVNILDDSYDILSLYPNPTTGLTEVIFNNYASGEAMLNVTSSDGKVIVNTPINTVKGANRFTVDMTEQKDGVYIVSVITRDKVYKSILIKK